MATTSIHVVPDSENGWGLKCEGDDDFLSTHDTQKDAIEAAVNTAEEEDDSTSIVIHRSDGRIRQVRTINDDETGTTPSPNGNGTTRSQRSVASNGTATEATMDSAYETDAVLTSVGSRIRWGAVLSGFFVAIAVSLALSVLGIAISLTAAGFVSAYVLKVFGGTWVALTLLGSLFVGGLVISRLTVGESEILEPSVYGVVLWALFVFVLPILPAANSGLGFGSLNSASTPDQVQSAEPMIDGANLTEEKAATITEMAKGASPSQWTDLTITEAAWLSFLGIVLSLLAAVGGTVIGSQFDEKLTRIESEMQPAMARK